MMDGNGCPVDQSAEVIQEFFTEHPDTRMGVAFDDTTKNFVVRLDEEVIGSGVTIEKAVFSAKKHLAIKKVLVLGKTMKSGDKIEVMAAAVKRAAILTNEKEFEKLMSDVENIRKHLPNFPEE